MGDATWHTSGLGDVSRWPLRAHRDPERAAVDLKHVLTRGGGAGKVWTVYELACFLSPLVVDVLPVIMQRQALAVLCRFSMEVPQLQFFDVVGFQFWDMVVH